MEKESSKYSLGFKKRNLIRSRGFPLEIDWPALREENVTFSRSSKNGSAHETITKSVQYWEDFFYKVEPILLVRDDGPLPGLEFETVEAVYTKGKSSAAIDIFCHYLNYICISKTKNLRSGWGTWFFVGSDNVIGDASDYWLFFISCGSEILIEVASVNAFCDNPEKYLKITDADFKSSDYGFRLAQTKTLYQKFYTQTDFGRHWWLGMEQGAYSYDPVQDSVAYLASINKQLNSFAKTIHVYAGIVILCLIILLFKK